MSLQTRPPRVDADLTRLALGYNWSTWTSPNGRLVIIGNCLAPADANETPIPSSSESISAVAGLLLLQNSLNHNMSEAEGRATLCRSLASRDFTLLPKANGTYCAAFYFNTDDRLVLCSDSIGARPLYYTVSHNILYFSTSLELLLEVLPHSQCVDLIALAQRFRFVYPLRDRTLAKDIKVLTDNALLISESSSVTVTRYYDWQHLETAPRNLSDEMATCLDSLRVAILERKTTDSIQYALLSGGLDSRSIVAFLCSFGCQVQAATIALPERLDYRYAHDFARTLGIEIHDSMPLTDELLVSGDARERSLLVTATKPFRGHPVFSGDGGGETFGFLIMTSPIVNLLQEGKVDDAIRQYSMESTLPFSILTTKSKLLIRDQLYLGMKEEFDEMKNLAPVKAFQLFLLRNDLRRHLHSYLDNLDTNCSELLLPFYDRRVIASVLRIAPPLTDYIRHAFYYKLLQLFPPSVTEIPWQAYPNSIPCPVPSDGGGLSQWDAAAASSQEDSQRLMLAATQSLFKGDGIGDVVMRHRVLGAALLHFLKLRKYGYLFANYLAIRNVYQFVERR